MLYRYSMQLDRCQKVFPSLRYLDSVDSTNLELQRSYQPSTGEFTVVVASEQTAGLGRLGRTWVSEPGTSISISVLLKPTDLEHAGFATLLAANSVHRALTDLTGSEQISIKWPNDILIGERKVCGILAQLHDSSVILGIGINLKRQNSAPEHATALEELVDAAPEDVVLAVLTELRARWEVLKAQGPAIELLYLRNHCSTLGTNVRAELPGGEIINGVAKSITAAGHLVIDAETEVELAAADVWHLRN